MSPRARRRSLIGAGATLLVSFLLVGVFNAVYTVHEVQQSDQQLCEVIAVSLMPRPTPPSNPAAQPSTTYGRELQAYTQKQAAITEAGIAAMHRLSDRVDCPK